MAVGILSAYGIGEWANEAQSSKLLTESGHCNTTGATRRSRTWQGIWKGGDVHRAVGRTPELVMGIGRHKRPRDC